MAKKNDPKFVRLTPRLSRSCIADVQVSGWSISGLDVKPFPEGDSARQKEAAKFVRRQLGAGHLEPCSRAEWEEVQEMSELISQSEATHQEAKFVRKVEEATEQIRKSREEAVNSGANGATGEAEDDEDEDLDAEESGEETPAPKKSKAASKKK